MKSVFRFIVFLLLVVGWGLAALALHVIRTPDEIGFTIITKERFGLADTYVDTRKWTLEDVGRHPLVVKKLIEMEKADVLKHVISDAHKGDVQIQLIGALQRATTENTATATQPASASSMLQGIFSLF